MTVEYALQHRKSCRSFLDQPVDRKLLRSIIQQASRAPSNTAILLDGGFFCV